MDIKPNLPFAIRNPLINSFQWIAFALMFTSISCHKGEEGTSISDTEFCLVEINGTFEDIDLDEPPAYLDGGHDGFITAMFEVLKYPAEARENSIQGVCILHYEITEQGTVENIIVIQDPGGGIGQSAVSAFETVTAGISYSPGILGGVAVRVRKELKLTYRLQ
ncbi:MAG TPA: energy transducer TonB [Saprospiraceae bacterium]|nr:energy transducer TonB [Saprospiraceae bacterium]